MSDNLFKLLSIASEPILTPPHQLEMSVLASAGKQRERLFESLAWKNGWHAFESALHFFPLGKKSGVMDLQSWNSEDLWRNCYGDLAKGCFFFAEDVFGVQFCFKEERIHTFNPETGETKPFANDLGEWAQTILDGYNLHTGYKVASEWQALNGPLRTGERLFPKIPFVFQGSYGVDNLYALDCVEGMRFLASIARQVRDLPDGTKAKLRVIP